jgi:hypothetical protein
MTEYRYPLINPRNGFDFGPPTKLLLKGRCKAQPLYAQMRIHPLKDFL